jgi:hypothetical protein
VYEALERDGELHDRAGRHYLGALAKGAREFARFGCGGEVWFRLVYTLSAKAVATGEGNRTSV